MSCVMVIVCVCVCVWGWGVDWGVMGLCNWLSSDVNKTFVQLA